MRKGLGYIPIRNRLQPAVATKTATESTAGEALERAKAIATIFSAIAIPIVLTIAGYFIQRQLSDAGIRKDYVGIATAILKESAKTQEPELREWAVRVLDENSPIPFSKRAKEGLLTGAVVAGPAWIPPPADCMTPPRRRTLWSEHKKLADRAQTATSAEFSKELVEFANFAAKQEEDAQLTAARLKCLQDWVKVSEQSDIDYRRAIGAPSSKSVLEDVQRRQAASAPKPNDSSAAR
jgi:hypothetical protein